MGAHADVVQSNSLKRGDRIAGRYGIQPSTEAWMNVMHRPAVLLCREIAGCALQTWNELVDQAVRKVAPFSNCVNTEQTHIIADDGKRPPAMLIPRRFEMSAARPAAQNVAIAWQTIVNDQPLHQGQGTADTCSISVNCPGAERLPIATHRGIVSCPLRSSVLQTP